MMEKVLSCWHAFKNIVSDLSLEAQIWPRVLVQKAGKGIYLSAKLQFYLFSFKKFYWFKATFPTELQVTVAGWETTNGCSDSQG